MRTRLRKIAEGKNSGPGYYYTGFGSKEDLESHYESTFVNGMSFDNYGEWQYGHRISTQMYAYTEEDKRRCWNRDNLFAQWATDNNALKVQLPADEQLLAIRHVWPVAWNNQLPSIEQRKEFERAAMRGSRAY